MSLLRKLSAFIFSALFFGLAKMSIAVEESMKSDFDMRSATLLIDIGDGDQDFFGALKKLKPVEESWFPNKIWKDRAYLFIVQNGSFKGRYVALTSRVLTPIPDQLAANGVASVVVHLFPLKNKEDIDFFSYDYAIGMSFVYIPDAWSKHYGSIDERLER